MKRSISSRGLSSCDYRARRNRSGSCHLRSWAGSSVRFTERPKGTSEAFATGAGSARSNNLRQRYCGLALNISWFRPARCTTLPQPSRFGVAPAPIGSAPQTGASLVFFPFLQKFLDEIRIEAHVNVAKQQRRLLGRLARAKGYAGSPRVHRPAEVCSLGAILQHLVIGEDLTQRNAGRFVEDKADDQTFSYLSGRRKHQHHGLFEDMGSRGSGRATRKSVLSPLCPLSGMSCATCAAVMLRTSKRHEAKTALDLSMIFPTVAPASESSRSPRLAYSGNDPAYTMDSSMSEVFTSSLDVAGFIVSTHVQPQKAKFSQKQSS